MTSMTSSPRLQPELEYDIFVLAYQNDRKEAKNLALVAKRVFDWLIRHIFRVVVFSNTRSIPIRFNKTIYRRHGHHVRHLYLQSPDMQEHLDMFPNVVNLVFWIDHDLTHPSSLIQLPLTLLSTGSFEVTRLLARKLIYLDLIATFGPHSTDDWASLYLPQLTHLCVLYATPRSSVELFLDRKRCPELRMVISWDHADSEFPVLGELNEDLAEMDDARVVAVKCYAQRDWEAGARGGMDMWRFAEGIIADRNGTRL
ncbi:hypothetical protein BDN72DRAFT_844739 [Pluteus cervinus]|uniref:Uncharacterized protein n=1 Tax=Pluteus cervinus TaxID=181527 RepID=A0ACD3AKF1_9AGAR|nr:hypothetical protein BDN72DRAFT_844739 [Pluteus cervinus]